MDKPTSAMDKPTSAASMHKLSLHDEPDEDVEDLFGSPESGANTQKHTPTSQPSRSATSQRPHYHARSTSQTQAQQDQEEARTARLRAELARVKEVNRVVEGVTASLTKAKDNMATVNQTVQNASTLLATWTRILSQTEHNQRLILNPAWQGASADVEAMEGEELRRRQEGERRAAEEERRREEAARRREQEEEERARRVASASAAPERRGSTRGRGGRGTGSGVSGVRGTRVSARGVSAGRGGPAGSARGAPSSGYGRVSSGTRGRGRGVG